MRLHIMYTSLDWGLANMVQETKPSILSCSAVFVIAITAIVVVNACVAGIFIAVVVIVGRLSVYRSRCIVAGVS